ncbi:MAG TPA: F0F1 ATP synthase subunit B [Pseudobacteroides sp.]|nr:F0F1 ATP synthase subunit B [Pseudobacteroides sp.]
MLIYFEKFRFIFVFINFMILYFFLRKFLFKPVTQFMENRTNMIKNSLDNAEKSKNEASQLKLQYEEQLKSAKDEADKIINDAIAKANKEYEEILNNARKDAEAILAKGREEIEIERAQMLKEVKSQVASLALTVASKVVEANMDNESNRRLAEKFIDEAGAA